MNRIVAWLLALVAAGSALWTPSALAHGLHRHAPASVLRGDAPAPIENARTRADGLASPRSDVARSVASASLDELDLRELAVLAVSSHCPPDDGLPCACGADRCTNPQPPRIALARAGILHAAPSSAPTEAIGERRRVVDVRRSPPGSVGSRAPPAFS